MLFFTKPSILALKWESMKNIPKMGKNRFKINLVFEVDFSWTLEPTWVDFGSQVEASDLYPPRHFFKLRPGGGQEAPKRLPRAPQERPRASQEHPRASQERPRATKTCPGGAQGASAGYFFKDFFLFPCFFTFFWVLLYFFMFFWIF